MVGFVRVRTRGVERLLSLPAVAGEELSELDVF
jgi:hypothetical protein